MTDMLRIGDVAAAAGVPAATVRYYERRGLLPRAPRTPAGYRQYGTETPRRLRFIRHAQELGFSLEEIQSMLALRSDDPAACRRTALLGALCCVGPLLFITLGVGAGVASAFEPLRPLFGTAMVGFFALGFYRVYGKGAVAASPAVDRGSDGAACEIPRNAGRDVKLLWAAAVLALVLWTFPTWSMLFL